MAHVEKLLRSHRKRLSNSESTENVVKRKRMDDRPKLILTDLNNDCLIAIFDYLTVNDLMNVIEASDRLSLAAGSAVRRKEVVITNVYEPNTEKVPHSVKLLRNVGRYISKLIINYKSKFHYFDKLIEDSIIEHCRHSLLEITFENPHIFMMHENTECFPKVLKVKLMDGEWCYNNMITEFNKWFPNAQSLDFEGLQYSEYLSLRYGEYSTHSIRQNFPSLKHLGLFTHVLWSEDEEYDKYLYLSKDDILAIIGLNPQLSSLKVEYIGNDILPDINKLLPQLTNLEICSVDEDSPKGDENCEHDDALLFKNLKFLKIHLDTYSDDGICGLANISISTTRLEKLELKHRFKMTEECIKLLYVNRNMHTLRLSFQCDGKRTAENLLELFPKLPNLTELEMDYQHNLLTLIQLIKLFKSCKSLNKLTINHCNPKEFQAFDESWFFTDELEDFDWTTIVSRTVTVVLNRGPSRYIN